MHLVFHRTTIMTERLFQAGDLIIRQETYWEVF